ncbi:MAG: hypothetical protein J6P13_04315 [Kiritimatiellae bacterium]|nr:hypothetical protein [Kiritimatiellia bacterium]
MKKSLISLALAFAAFVANAVPVLRLVYGKDWSEAGRKLRKTFESAAFKAAAKGRYSVEIVDDSAGDSPKNLGTLKLPALFAISERGNCFCVIENLPAKAEPEQILKKVAYVDKIRQKAEAEGWRTADKCGEFLEKMERFTGGPKRVISEGFYPNVFKELVRLDPEDKTGWQRHFTMGDGIDIVEKATQFRKKGAISNGEAFIEEEFKKPRKHLTKEQQQALLMAKFALYRGDESKKAEQVEFLSKIAAAGEDTFWGTSALGWLNILGEPPLSVYWGWRQGDFKGQRFATPVKYGVDAAFQRPGKYTISFIKESGVNLKIESVVLMAAKEEVATLEKPQISGDTTSFEYTLPTQLRGRIVSMVVKGSTDAAGGSSGKIKIERQTLKPRKEVK